MPFKSVKQERFMFAKHPAMAKKWVRDAKAKGEASVQKSWIPGKGWVKATEAGKEALRQASKTNSHKLMRRVSDSDAHLRHEMETTKSNLLRSGIKPGVQSKYLPSGVNGATWRTGSKKHGQSYVVVAHHVKGEHKKIVTNHELAHAAPRRSSYRFHTVINNDKKLGHEEARAVWRSGERTPLSQPAKTHAESDNGYRMAYRMTDHSKTPMPGGPGHPGTTGTKAYGDLFNKLQGHNPNPKPLKMPGPKPKPAAQPKPGKKRPISLTGAMTASTGASTVAGGGYLAHHRYKARKPEVSKSLTMWEGVSAVSKSDPDASAVHVMGSGSKKGKLRRTIPPRPSCM